VERYSKNKNLDIHIEFPADETDVLTISDPVASILYSEKCSATSDNDPNQKHDWRMYTIEERSFMAPGRIIQVINPTISTTHTNMPFYLFQSSVLVALTASIFQGLTTPHLKSVPKISPSQEYPYREASGE
jgi:hypothetical protein